VPAPSAAGEAVEGIFVKKLQSNERKAKFNSSGIRELLVLVQKE
jgi:hypothetical protein